jgi:hypothetical protein
MPASGDEGYVSDRRLPNRDLKRRLWFRRKKMERQESRRAAGGRGPGKGQGKGKRTNK